MVAAAHKEAERRLEVKRLSKEQKKALFKTVRYPQLTHQELLALTVSETFALANEYVVEGLSVKLNNFEEVSRLELGARGNIEPRSW